MVVILVRHAESESNTFIHHNEKLTAEHLQEMNAIRDPKITPAGQEHANQTARYLRDVIPDIFKIWVSPFARAIETARPLADSAREVIIIPELQEYTPSTKTPPSGFIIDKDWSSFGHRVIDMKEKLRTIPQDDVVVIYGHSLFFSVLLSHLSTQEQSKLGDSEIALHLPNCSISTLSWVSDHWEIYNIGSVGHLKNPTGTHVPFGTLANV